MKKADYRQIEIVKYIELNGVVDIDSLAKVFSVTPITLRRDIDVLSKKNLLKKGPGVVMPASSKSDILKTCIPKLTQSEADIYSALVDTIEDNRSVYLGSGKVASQIASLLLKKNRLVCMTGDLRAANILRENTSAHIHFIGGFLNSNQSVTCDLSTLKGLPNYRFDYAIFLESHISNDGQILDSNCEETKFKQMILDVSEHAVLLIQKNCPNPRPFNGYAHITDFDMVYNIEWKGDGYRAIAARHKVPYLANIKLNEPHI